MPDFETDLERLKIATLDALMFESGYQAAGDIYIHVGLAAVGLSPVLPRPGQGFAVISLALEAAVGRWRDIPTSDAFTDDATRFRNLASQLGYQGAQDALGTTSTVPGHLTVAGGYMDKLQGVAFSAFRSRYITSLTVTMQNQGLLAGTVSALITLQSALWAAAEADVAEAVSFAADVMEGIPQKISDARHTLTMRVLSAITGAIGMSASSPPIASPIVVPLSIANASADVVDAIADYNDTISGATAEATLTSLTTALSSISGIIAAEEVRITALAAAAADGLYADRGSYDLAFSHVDVSNRPQVIKVDDSDASNVLDAFDDITEVFGGFVRDFTVPNAALSARPAQIGLASPGAAKGVVGLAGVMLTAMQSTLRTTEAGTQGLERALDVFAQLDDDNGARGRDLMRYLETLS